jgi:hypothetical protein
MTKIEQVLAELSELYEFYARIQARKWRKAVERPQDEPCSLPPEANQRSEVSQTFR